MKRVMRKGINMVQYDETRLAMEALEPELEDLRGALNLDGIKIKLDELEMKTTEPNFWDDAEKSGAVLQQIGRYKQTISDFEKLKENRDDVLTMIELAEEENDESMVDEVKELAEKVKSNFEEQKLGTLLKGEYDSCNAILSFHAGAGGTEAQD
ncbi:MAG TPA: peptide chain release factor 2, partial [Ruminococcaceae bacterium]|nr:peptide chain release factor 2 [Oscillospiraceae bacterium]